MQFLLDTNILSQAVREPRGDVANRIRHLVGQAVYTSVVVAAELRFGAAKRQSKRMSELVEAVLKVVRVAPVQIPVDKVYAESRWTLERAGTPIGANDLIIASQAINDGSTVVTDNLREFSRVPGLVVENWLTRSPN